MTSFFAPADVSSIPVHVVRADEFEDWLTAQPTHLQSWVTANAFTGSLGQALLVPDAGGAPQMALAGFGTAHTRARSRFHLAGAARKLPAGTYGIASGLSDDELEIETLGWLLGNYQFSRYCKKAPSAAQLECPATVDRAYVDAVVAGEFLTRDLINIPSNDLGPEELEAAARDLAVKHGARMSTIAGDALVEQNFPLIHTVGRASDRVPRLIDLAWGDSGPKITLVGKGVCFDTGGLNLKPAGSMGLMKKDMGGAANVLGLGHMVMAMGLNIRLRILIPAVENSVSGNAFRPGDILTSRRGLTVEINNTDAEGRLVLADALSYAQEDNPDVIISMATLTGAARVAVGPELAPFYCDDESFVTSLQTASHETCDPVWRMPFYTPYESMIEPGIADLDNAPKGGFAGSITAALFLRRFVEKSVYAHFDVYGWNPKDAPGFPKGGAGQATRALLEVLTELAQ
jgi:leucyl aminopeptidase